MGNKFYDESDIQDIADAIRSKNGTQNTYTVAQMAAAIGNIPTGITPTGTINIISNGTYNVTDKASAVVAVPTGVMTCATATYTCTSAKGNQDVTLISGNSFIAANYSNAKAFALMVKTSGLQSNGILMIFNTNQQFGVISSSDSRPVSGWFTACSGEYANSGNRLVSTLSTASTSVGHMYATSAGNLIIHAGGTNNAFQTGNYFIIFGLME